MNKENGREINAESSRRNLREILIALKENLITGPIFNLMAKAALDRIQRKVGNPNDPIMSGKGYEGNMWVGDSKYTPPPHNWTF